MIKIVIPGKPLPWRAPVVCRNVTFSPRAKQLKLYKYLAADQYQGELIRCAVNCDVISYIPIPVGTTKANRMLMLAGKIRPAKRPDRTNIAKLVEDALNGTVIEDDSLIVGGRVEKWYCERPRVELIISKIEGHS